MQPLVDRAVILPLPEPTVYIIISWYLQNKCNFLLGS